MSHASDATRTSSGQWQRQADSIAWRTGDQTIWKLSLDPNAGNKPFFHPLSVAGGPPLTSARPEDHPWHYGLWFSWKYINGVNYWEESRETDRPDGITRWKLAALETKPDGSAAVRLDIQYVHPCGRVDLTENRTLNISAPSSEGRYDIDWQATFAAGKEGALLDRTPLPGEPNGEVNGGYGGLGLRAAFDPLAISYVSSESQITQFIFSRARPSSRALAANFRQGDRDAGAIAIVNDSPNAPTPPPWYIANTSEMRFSCAALLAPKPVQLAAGETLTQHYRIAVRRAAWTPEALRALAAGS